MKLSVLTLTYNRHDLSMKYIPSIINRIGSIDAEFLIWDNGSNDGTYEHLVEQYKNTENIKICKSQKNYGVEAINFLAEKAQGTYILKVDDDIIPPINYGSRLVAAYEHVHLDQLLFLGWDMLWGEKTFATRSGVQLYKNARGRTINICGGNVFVHYTPRTWMVNGVCRLCTRERFLDIGGHPAGVLYGVDTYMSRVAEQYGYWIGFFSPNDLVQHMGVDTPDQRKFKDIELRKHNSPKHV